MRGWDEGGGPRGFGYRGYPQHTTGRLAFIRDVLSIRDAGQAPGQHVTALVADHLRQVEERIAELTRARASLRELAKTASATGPSTRPGGPIRRIMNGG